jgi:hypothetical protein
MFLMALKSVTGYGPLVKILRRWKRDEKLYSEIDKVYEDGISLVFLPNNN